MRKGRITRNLELGFFEDGSYAADDFKEGDVVYEYTGYTYGVITPKGVPVSRIPDVPPFQEVPKWAVEWESNNG